MADGTIKYVQDIKVGDYVMSPKSEPVLVTSLGRGQEEMFEIKSKEKHHESFTVNKSHILSLIKEENEIINIIVEDYLKFSESQKQNIFRGYRVAIEYPYKEVSIDPYYFGLQLYNNFTNKYIISDFMINSRKIRLQVLAGIIDSNKYKNNISEKENTLDMTFVEEQLAIDTVKLLRSLGFRACKFIKDIKINNEIIKNYIINAYGDFSIVPTKVYKWEKQILKENPLTFGFEVIPKGIGDYYGFTINSKDHLFLLGDYTVTHNTESIASIVGFLLDNYSNMRIGIFTPKIQQAEMNVGRTAIFYQMNEEKLNNEIIKCNKQKIELSNKSYVQAVSGSDQSNIEGLTFDVIILDEAQKITNYTWSERISPMGLAFVQ